MSENKPKFSTREEWLTWAAVKLQEEMFYNTSYSSSDRPSFIAESVKISCGFPIGSRGGRDRLAQCLSPKVSDSGLTEIYISPVLSDEKEVLANLHHELVHAFIGVEEGHGRVFKAIAEGTGLNGPMKSTTPSLWATNKYKLIVDELGPYPHSAVKLPERGSKGSNLIKCHCANCGYIIRTTAKWLEVAKPMCPNPACLQHNNKELFDNYGEDIIAEMMVIEDKE